MLLNSSAQLDPDAHAPAESQAHVLLGPVSQLSGAQNVLPRYQVQQEQYCAARQVVLKLSVSHFYLFLFAGFS